MEPDFIERRREKLKESLDDRIIALAKTISFDGAGMQTSVMHQDTSISDAKKEIKAGKLLKRGALKSIQDRQEAHSQKFVQCEANILPEIEGYCKYFCVKNLVALNTPRKQAMQLDLMEFILKKHNQNATALESLNKDSEKASKEYNANALVPLRAAVAAFNDLRTSAARIADPWMSIRGEELITAKTASEINKHLATTFQDLDVATKTLIVQLENADKVLKKNEAQLEEMAKVVKSVHKYDGSIEAPAGEGDCRVEDRTDGKKHQGRCVQAWQSARRGAPRSCGSSSVINECASVDCKSLLAALLYQAVERRYRNSWSIILCRPC